MTVSFERAFSRNIGLVSSLEQQRLARACVAIPGVGGVGGWHAITLARHGVGRFRIADFDTFTASNLNRQAGAFVSTMGLSKVDVLRDTLLDINPDADVTVFREPIGPANVDAFLDGADVVLDGIDFFALDARRTVFEAARRRSLWALTAGPLGFGAAILAFAPESERGMTFERYFDFESCASPGERLVAFAAGLAPAALHAPYMDLSRVDFREKHGPSAALACELCASALSMETLRLLLGWGTPLPAPAFQQLDLATRVWARGTLHWGNRGPLQRLKRAWLTRTLESRGVRLAMAER
jgi:molybdopterin/thiamine biosynthesis adenylyltransferase